MKRHCRVITLLFFLLLNLLPVLLYAQGNKLSIQATPPKNMSVCGYDDTTLITVYNISSSVITGVKVTVNLPAGVKYIAGSLSGSSVSESNITNLNKPVFSGPNLLIAQNFRLRIRVKADCDIIPLMSGSNTPQIDIRVDYTGNFDNGSSIPFVPLIPSPGYASITNISFIGNVGDKFVRRVTITNYGKGPLSELRLIRINGKDISGKPQAGFNNKISGDTLTTWLKSTDFVKQGDKDSLLEQNESVIITDTFTINGCNKTTTYYEIGWGCGGKICQLIKNNAAVTISSDNPNLKTWTSSVDKWCYDGKTPNAQYLTITNTGKKEARDVKFYIMVGTGSANTYFDTASVYVKKGANSALKRKNLDSASKYYTGVSCVPSNSISYMMLKFGNLAPGDTLYVSWDMFRCASATCGYAFYDLNWLYYFDYKNQCNNVTNVGAAWGKVYRYAQGSASAWVPTDLVVNETKDFKFEFSSFYELPMSSSGRIRIDLVLPPTLQHSLSKSDFFITNGNLTATWSPDSIAMRGDTLRGYFGSAFKFNLSMAELTVRLKGICSKYNGNTSLPVTMSLYYNPQPSCNPFVWIRPVCLTFNTKVHCSSNCNVGLWFKDFEANRTSFGQPDNNNDGLPDASGSLDMTKVRKERVMFGDTITTVFIGRPKTNSTYKNWRYGYAESFITYGSYVDVVDANLIVYKGTTKQTGTCNSVRVKKILSGAHATFKFDFTVDSIYPKGCLSSAYRFTSNDSIRLVVRYRVSKNIGGTTALMNFANRFYFGSVANPGAGQVFQCDTFGANMLLYGYYYANCCSDNIVYSNCAERVLSQSWYLGIGPCCQNYAGNNLFKYEFRNFVKIKAVRVHLPSGFKLGQTYFGQYRTSGVGSYVLEKKDTIPPVKGTSNPYVFEFRKYYKDSGGVLNAGDDGVQGYFNYSVQPRCNLQANTPIRIDYDYIFEKQGVLGSGFDTLSTGSYDVFTFNPPALKLQPAIPTIYATSDTVEWELRYTNPSVSFNAYNIWLSPANTANIKVVQIRDLDADTLIKPSKDIFRAGVLNAGKMRRFKVRAVFNNCDPDSLVIYGSYNCAEYPDDFASYPCVPNSTALYIEPQNTRLQLTLTDSVSTIDLCSPNKMTLLVENIQAVTAYNTKIRISLPIGMEVIGASAQMRYPLKGTPLNIGKPTLVSGTIYEWDLAKLSSAVAKGFSGTSDTSRNKILITFRVTTNCDYASGSFVSTRAIANIKCGDPIPAIPAFSNPQDIKGVTRPYYTLVKSWADTLLPCQKPMYIKSRVIFLGPGKSGAKDRVEIFLPDGVNRDTSYWNAVRNAPHKDSVTLSNINGANLLSWKMPADISPGDSMEFDIRVTGDGARLNCGPVDVITRSVVIQPVICVSTNTPCDIKVITGSELANPIVDKGNLQIDLPKISTRLIGSDSEQVSLNFIIKNTGNHISNASSLIVRYHYDRNNSGKWDVNDDILGTDSFIKTLKKDSFFSITRTLKVKAGQSCGILAVIDSAACACLFGQKLFPVPQLKNAGNDTAICSGKPLNLGIFPVNQFAYLWDNIPVLDTHRVAKPKFIATNQSGIAETHRLILTTNRGTCNSRDTVMVVVNPVPAATVLNSDTSVCARTGISLVATVKGGNGGNKYNWTPATGLSAPTALKTNAVPDSNTLYRFTVTDSKGCSAKDSVFITTHPFPKAWFTWPVTCQGNDVLITDSSVISSGNITLRLWKTPVYDTFGVTQLKLNPGTASGIPVTLITESAIGCNDTVTRLVDVRANPVADFKAAYVCEGDSSKFVNLSTLDSGRIIKMDWTFGDGMSSQQINPTHKYTSAADHSVTLVVKSESGCTDTTTGMARVFPKPKADFSVNTVCEHDSLRYVNLSQLFGDTLSAYYWDFGLRGNSLAFQPVLYSDTFGIYNSKLKVLTIHGCADSVARSTNVFALPKASFTVSDHCLKQTAVFTQGSTIAQGSITSSQWKFGDGNTSSSKNPSHTYAAYGTWMPSLYIVSDQGCRDSVAGQVEVWPLAKPRFTFNNHCYKEQLSAVSSYYGGGNPATYTWYPVTGDSAGTQDLIWNYNSAGNYNLRLRLTTDKGCVADTQATVTVYPLPVVSAVNSVPCNDDSVVLSGNATIVSGSIANYTWYLSDGSVTNGKNISKIFTSSGNQNATLVATSDRGCKDSSMISFRTNPKVTVDFIAPDVCLDEVTDFTNLSVSSEPISKYSWKFGDGRVSSLKDPQITYTKAGVFTVELTIETLTGCTYTVIRQVEVFPKPVPGFNIDPKAGTIVNPNILITDMSSGADTLWYYSTDGFSTTQRNFTHAFPDSGSFTIWQVVKTDHQCYDSISENIFIHYMYTLYVPQTFTPNADTKNETFGPGGMGIEWFSMKVYSRWGELVYATDNSERWDGTIAGTPAMEGVYAVLITVRDYKGKKHYYQGSLTVLR